MVSVTHTSLQVNMIRLLLNLEQEEVLYILQNVADAQPMNVKKRCIVTNIQLRLINDMKTWDTLLDCKLL